MCQEDIVNYLIKKRGVPVDIVELCRVIPANRKSISKSCASLRKSKEVKSTQVKQKNFVKFIYFV